jgi:MoaA/NifB/PqqE/SkfB family radical SAM enzyme
VTFLERQRLRARSLLYLLTRGERRWLSPPRMLQIEVTNRCDLFCRTCTRMKLPVLGDMSYQDFTRIIDSLPGVRTIWLSGQGEPLLNPDLPRMIRYCTKSGITGTILNTNAMLLHSDMLERLASSGLGELRISIDGGTREDSEYLRDGSDFAAILENARAFARLSATPVAFYVLLNRKNHASVPLLPALAAKAGARRIYAVETVPFRDTSSEREIFDRREFQFASLSRAVQTGTLAALREEGRRHGIEIQVDLKWYRVRCLEPARKMYIDFRGNVTPCCRIHYEVIVGNVLRDGPDAVWYGAPLMQWRRSLRRRRDHARICVERCNLGIGRTGSPGRG